MIQAVSLWRENSIWKEEERQYTKLFPTIMASSHSESMFQMQPPKKPSQPPPVQKDVIASEMKSSEQKAILYSMNAIQNV